jgi:hypothetical protein
MSFTPCGTNLKLGWKGDVTSRLDVCAFGVAVPVGEPPHPEAISKDKALRAERIERIDFTSIWVLDRASKIPFSIGLITSKRQNFGWRKSETG